MFDFQAAKHALREEARVRRNDAARSLADLAPNLVAEHFFNAVPVPPGSIVGGYFPIGKEVDVRPLMRRLAAAGHLLCLPVAEERATAMKFRQWQEGRTMALDAFNVPAPDHQAREAVPNVLLLPLLAFDQRGHRLGYSAGFYDVTLRALRAAGGVVAVGIGYGAQEVPRVPNEAHDEALDWVVTERAARRFG